MNFFYIISCISIFISNCDSSFNNGSSSLLAEMEISVNPSEIIVGLTPSFEVECLLNQIDNPSRTTVLSIIISHSKGTDSNTEFNYIASVNEIESQAHNLTSDFESINGSVDNKGLSFLRISYKNPSPAKEGLYKCEASGFDALGKPVSIFKIASINTTKLSLGFLLSELRTIREYLDEEETIIIALKQRLHAIRETLFYISPSYKGHRYYMRKDIARFINTEAQAVCEMHGGYLVELDNHEEFVFVRNFITKFNISLAVMTGANDIDQEGVWINTHNPTSRPSFDWGSDKPSISNVSSCQCFHSSFNWYLSDCYCSFPTINKRDSYVCEVPDETELIFNL